jgi:hypothetical protein
MLKPNYSTPILLFLAKNARYIHKEFYATCCKKNSCEHRTGSIILKNQCNQLNQCKKNLLFILKI